MNILRNLFKPKVMISGLLVAVGLTLGYGMVTSATQAGVARDCDTNSVEYKAVNGGCGSLTPSEFKADYNTNAEGDLHNIYANSNFGLLPSQIDQFASTAKMGTAYKNGNIVVDGQVVATNAWSLGRHTGNGNDHSIVISGKTYYWGYNSTAFGVDSIPVMVMFDANGEMQFGALTACGNPITGNKVKPNYSCNLMSMTPVAGKDNTYNFTTNYTATNNAKFVKVIYNFGDGTSAESTTPSVAIQHQYAKAGTATATVVVTVPGGQTKTVAGYNCTHSVTIQEKKQPIQQCIALTVIIPDAKNNKDTIQATITSNQANGATLQDGNINFGDGNSASNLKPTDASHVKTTHTYAKDGTYNVVATLDFNTAKGVTSQTCEANITISPTPCAINPTVPVGSPECAVCQYNSNLPVNSPECTPPQTCQNTPSMPQCTPPATPTTPTSLPSTGPTEIVATTLGIGGTVAAAAYYIASRRNLLASLFTR